MLFPEEDSPVLKEWIVKRLENTFVTLAPFQDCPRLVPEAALLTPQSHLDQTPTPTSLQIMFWLSCTMRTTATISRAFSKKR